MKTKAEIDLSVFSEALGVDIMQKTKKRAVAAARFVVFRKLSKHGLCQQDIADIFEMHRTSILYGLKEAEDKLSIDDKLVTGLWHKIKDLKI